MISLIETLYLTRFEWKYLIFVIRRYCDKFYWTSINITFSLRWHLFSFSLYCWQRAAADQILRELQSNPDTWLQAVHILQNSQNLNTKFFTLQVREALICFHQIPNPQCYFYFSLVNSQCSPLHFYSMALELNFWYEHFFSFEISIRFMFIL